MGSEQALVIGLTSFAIAVLLVITGGWHERWTGDFENSGVQKHHRGSPPRIGVLPILVALLLGVYLLSSGHSRASQDASRLLALMLAASLPVVLLGFADDVTKKVPPRMRLLGAIAAGALAIALLGIRVVRVDIPLIDSLVAFVPVSVVITLLMVGGFTNAMNIVDGLNGLASGLALLMLGATAFVAARFGDTLVLDLCVVLAMAVGGFFLVNFPRGGMFLGDGGAYLIGFLLVQIWMLLLSRNPGITAWMVMAIAFQPTMETIFSIYRRRFRSGRSGAMSADRLHLHSLVYRRRTRTLASQWPWLESWVANAGAAVIVVGFGAVPMVAAALAPSSTAWALVVICTSVGVYLTWFRRMVTVRARRRAAVDAAVGKLPESSAPSSEPTGAKP